MNLEELNLIKQLITIHSDAALHSTYPRVIFILNREIKLKETDFRKETSK